MKRTLIAALTLTLISTTVQAKETIRFGMEATYPPFEYMNDELELTGFDVELAKAICAELKATCEFTNQPFDSLIPGLRFRRIDAVISGMDITPQRLQQVNFTEPYYENSAIFVSESKDKFNKAEDFIGKTVGVQNGSTHQAYLIDKLENQGVKIRPYDSYQNALLDMMNGRIDGVFADTAVAREWLSQQEADKFQEIGAQIADPMYFGMGLGIATRKDDPLGEKLNTALKAVKANGTWKTLHNKYFNSGK